MSALHQSVSNLKRSVSNLKGAVAGLEDNLAGEQRDMFSSPSNQNVVAARLDSAIEQVESLLQEG